MPWDTTLPAALSALAAVDFDWEHFDWEPYPSFWPASENAAWIRAWTGNPRLDGSELRVFGQDGTGGIAAIWRRDPEAPLEAQPIVFFGSEGECGVVAGSLAHFAWLLAGGVGPMEAVESGHTVGPPHQGFHAVATQFFPDRSATPAEVLQAAQATFPDVKARIQAWVR